MPVPTFLNRLPFLHSFAGPPKRGPIVVASWDQVNVYFLVVRERKDMLAAVTWGTLDRKPERPPLSVLHQHLTTNQIAASRLVLLLPRTDLEMTTVEIPPADEAEVAALVRAEIEQLIGDGEHELVVDYRLLDGATPSVTNTAASATTTETGDADPGKQDGETKHSQTAVAFSLEQSELTAWTDAVGQTGLQLAAFTSRQTAPLDQLRQERVFRSSLSVLIVVYEGEVELSFFRGHRLASLRTFRAGSHEVDALTDQIQVEVQRSISLMDFVSPGEMPEMLVLVRGPRDAPAAGALGNDQPTDETLTLCESLGARPVTLSMPVDSSSRPSDATDSQSPDPVLVASALVFHEHQLAVDLIHPKVPPVPPSPVRRWAAIAALALGSLGVGTYTLLAEVNELKDQLGEKKQELVEAERVSSKMQEKADETRLVQQWLGDQVDWLGQLQRLSSKFPEGQLANVRRLSASVDGSTGIIDLSVQVSDPNRVADLENALRDAKFSITSKRVSEQANNEEYPWQFEARIAFPITPLDERDEEIFTQSPLTLESTEVSP